MPTRLLRSLRPWSVLLLLAPVLVHAQGVQPFVEHWDAKKTIKKSEGLFVNGREWGEWKFYDGEGRLKEQADFKSGERDGHVRIYYENGVVKHDGWFKQGKEDSLLVNRYRDGDIMEWGTYKLGKKAGTWHYFYPDSMPMLTEQWTDSTLLINDAWNKDGRHTLENGDGLMQIYYGSGAIMEIGRAHV